MNQVHVIHKDDEQWHVVIDGKDASVDTYDTKDDAVTFARELAQANDMELAIHNLDGEITRKDSSGDAPDSEAPDRT